MGADHLVKVPEASAKMRRLETGEKWRDVIGDALDDPEGT